jgi:prepilin-type N-terminal cleavage/methylation domain-containing protein
VANRAGVGGWKCARALSRTNFARCWCYSKDRGSCRLIERPVEGDFDSLKAGDEKIRHSNREMVWKSEKNMMVQLNEENEHDLNRVRARKKPRIRRRKERGYLLVELLIALTIFAILAAMAAPSIVGLQMAANNSFAWNTVSSVYFTGKALAVCNSYQTSCPQLVMPSDGTWHQAGYTFTFSSSGGGGAGGGSYNWSFAATPIVYGVTGIHSYSASPSGIVQTN